MALRNTHQPFDMLRYGVISSSPVIKEMNIKTTSCSLIQAEGYYPRQHQIFEHFIHANRFAFIFVASETEENGVFYRGLFRATRNKGYLIVYKITI